MEIAMSLFLGFVLGVSVTIGLCKMAGAINAGLDNQDKE